MFWTVRPFLLHDDGWPRCAQICFDTSRHPFTWGNGCFSWLWMLSFDWNDLLHEEDWHFTSWWGNSCLIWLWILAWWTVKDGIGLLFVWHWHHCNNVGMIAKMIVILIKDESQKWSTTATQIVNASRYSSKAKMIVDDSWAPTMIVNNSWMLQWYSTIVEIHNDSQQ